MENLLKEVNTQYERQFQKIYVTKVDHQKVIKRE